MLETIKTVIWEYRFIIMCVIAVGIFALMQWQVVKSRLYALMLQAKRMAKDAVLDSGQDQVDWVVDKAYKYLPPFFTVFISKDVLKRIIGYLYNKAQDYLDDGELNNSI